MYWKLIRLQLQQPEVFRWYTLAGHLTQIIFALTQCVLLLSLYRSWVLSALLRPPVEIPMQSAYDLAGMLKQNRYHLVATATSGWFYEKLALDRTAWYAELREAIAANPVVRVNGADEALDLVERGDHVVFGQEDGALRHESKQRCDLEFITKGGREMRDS